MCFSILWLISAPDSFAQSATTVDIISESTNSTSFPFYKGKALGNQQTQTRLYAIVHTENGQVINPSSLTYRWKYNNSVVTNSSDGGPSTFVYPGSLIGSIPLIEVEVFSQTGSYIGRAMANLAYTNPSVLLYEKDPLQGVRYERVLTNEVSLDKPEIEIMAIPFAFRKNHSLLFDWKLNQENIQNSETNNSVVLRNETRTAGEAVVSVSVRSLETVLDRAQANFRLLFR